VSGLHVVKITYCDCVRLLPRYQQLLRAGLFPATEKRPSTAVSFAFLEAYHKMSQAGKTNLYDFYMYVLLRADPLHLHHSVVSVVFILSRDCAHYTQQSLFGPVSLVVRMWRDLMALKRAGRGHDPSGVNGTQAGDLALLCPACPCPDYNLPLDWKSQADTSP
jgi:hypothetical protein